MKTHNITITEKQRKTIVSLLYICLIHADVEQVIVNNVVDDVAIGWRDCADDIMVLLDITPMWEEL